MYTISKIPKKLKLLHLLSVLSFCFFYCFSSLVIPFFFTLFLCLFPGAASIKLVPFKYSSSGYRVLSSHFSVLFSCNLFPLF